jgi:thioredoxin-like negative regulator of GroEL
MSGADWRSLRQEAEVAGFLESFEAVQESIRLIEEEKYSEALRLLEPYLMGDYTSIDVLYNLAHCYRELALLDEAADRLEQIVVRTANLPSLGEG